jgi:hypothetical protein
LTTASVRPTRYPRILFHVEHHCCLCSTWNITQEWETNSTFFNSLEEYPVFTCAGDPDTSNLKGFLG